MARAAQVRTKHPNEARNCAVSFDQILETGETLTGTPSVSFSPSGITVSDAKVSTAELVIDGDTVAVGRAIQFKASGGSAGVEYTGTVQTAGSTASPSQTPLVVVRLLVTNNG